MTPQGFDHVGLNVADPNFWMGGLKVLERFISELEKVV